ncbi:MAG TPA: hypothetical protein VMW10_06910 [Alphaproteobacteria bacterium]|nr:hypothetical protein [Alphaproteobacteria bacterium]
MFQLNGRFRQLLNWVLRRKYWFNFIEEFWYGQKEGTWIGRIEVHTKEGQWEIGIGTHDREAVGKLRKEYDFKTVTEKVYSRLKQKVSELNEVRK